MRFRPLAGAVDRRSSLSEGPVSTSCGSLPVEPAGEEIDAVRPPATVGPLEQVGPELEIGSVQLSPEELVGSLIELAGPV